MTTDRIKAPQVHEVDKIDFREPERQRLEGGTTLYSVYGGSQEVVRLDFTFRAGNWYERSKLEAMMAAAMISEGTKSLNAREIAEKFEFYGAQFNSVPYYDNNYVSLVALKKHLPVLLPLLGEVMRDSAFPEAEFEIARQKRKQRALVDAEKVALISQRNFLRQVMGEGHPYAPVAGPEAYDNVTREGAKSHYHDHYRSEGSTIFASGDVDEQIRNLLVSHFGQAWGNPARPAERGPFVVPSGRVELFVEKENASQNAISIGRTVPGQDHPDSPGLRFLTAILGGYFGSRLMSNLREEKGLTYGIQSSVVSFARESVFMIHAEVTAEKSGEAIREIFLEMEKLCSKLVSESELAPLRSYLLGRLLEDFDGPFARAQSFASLYEAGLRPDYFERVLGTIRTITPKQVRELARRYFDPGTMITVNAGRG